MRGTIQLNNNGLQKKRSLRPVDGDRMLLRWRPVIFTAPFCAIATVLMSVISGSLADQAKAQDLTRFRFEYTGSFKFVRRNLSLPPAADRAGPQSSVDKLPDMPPSPHNRISYAPANDRVSPSSEQAGKSASPTRVLSYRQSTAIAAWSKRRSSRSLRSKAGSEIENAGTAQDVLPVSSPFSVAADTQPEFVDNSQYQKNVAVPGRQSTNGSRSAGRQDVLSRTGVKLDGETAIGGVQSRMTGRGDSVRTKAFIRFANDRTAAETHKTATSAVRQNENKAALQAIPLPLVNPMRHIRNRRLSKSERQVKKKVAHVVAKIPRKKNAVAKAKKTASDVSPPDETRPEWARAALTIN